MKLKGKIYIVTIGEEKRLVKAFTKQGAIAHAAATSVQADYADQTALYEATIAGLIIEDITVDPKQPRLPGVDPQP